MTQPALLDAPAPLCPACAAPGCTATADPFNAQDPHHPQAFERWAGYFADTLDVRAFEFEKAAERAGDRLPPASIPGRVAELYAARCRLLAAQIRASAAELRSARPL